jgi:LuxR family maltose regulon positive regulatory protein
VERLNEGLSLGRKLTLISAPAGFGKTTLVSEWVSDCGLPVTWLSLDEGDNDTTRFLTYLIATLQTLPPKTGGTNIGAGALAMLQSSQPPPAEFILTTLLNDITSIPDNFVLVLDDYHLIDSRPVDEALTFLIEHAPPPMHLVITTRQDPSLPLARLRVRGQLTELRAVDLRFNPAETAEFLNRVMGLTLSAENIAALETRTEGWIAGLLLAALALQGTISMQGKPGAASFIQSFTGSHHFVLDYLLEEVLRRQSGKVQAFLLYTAILNRLCGSLCDAVLGDTTGSGQKTESQTTLEYLDRANLFIVPLDNERRWYRYHHLFGDLLRQRLEQSLSPAEIAEHHLRASHWYEKNGDMDEAFQHAFAADDFRRSAALAEAAYQGMDHSFQTAAWLGWVKNLPEDVVRIRPVLSTQMAQAFMDAGQPEASETHLQDAERCLSSSVSERVVTDDTQLEALQAMIAMTRAYNAQVQGDLAGTVKYAELALKLIPEGDMFRRAQATIMLEVTHWTRGDLEAARSALDDWMNSMRKAGNIVFVVASAFALADIQVAQGCLHEAAQTNQQAIQLAAEHGPEAQRITAHHYLGLALLQHEMGDDSAAAEYLQKAGKFGEQTTLVDWSYRWHIAQARLKESGGDLEAALVLLEEARRAYVKTPIPDTRPVDALKANVYLKQGRLDKAEDWVHKRGLSADDELNYLNEFEHLVLARMLIAEYQSQRSNDSLHQAIGLLGRLLKAAEAQRRTGSVIEILLTQAVARFASVALQAAVPQERGSLPLALASLERALTLAEPEGYVRLFVDEGEAVRLLLLDFRSWIEKQSSEQGRSLLVYVERLLSGFRSVESINPMTHPQKVDPIERLSERELEVLKLLRTELSGPEIAGQLVISPNTFRTHTKNIFSKLGVNNRRAAVRRAEELDLF